MAIVLRDLRAAVANYLDTKVTVSISAPAAVGGEVVINPNEEFTFNIAVTNSSGAEAIRLTNVRYAVDFEHSAAADLIVPPAPMVARSGPFTGNSVLAPGTRVDFMFLFPPDEKNALELGETETIPLRGRTGSSPTTTNIRFRVIADPDLDFLFPKNQDAPAVSRLLSIKPD